MKTKTTYICSECGYKSPKWLGKCPGCNSWNTIQETVITEKKTSATRAMSISGLVVEQAVIRGDAEIKKDQRTRKSPRISGSALIYGTVVGNVSVSGASVVGKGEKIEGGRNSAFLVFFDGDMPTSGVNQRKGISQDSHKKQKRKTAHRLIQEKISIPCFRIDARR